MVFERTAKIRVLFYKTKAGSEVVRDWLRDLNELDRNMIGQDLMRVQFRWPMGMPLCRSLKGGLWEVRTTLEHGRIARILFTPIQDCLIVLSGFIKKTQKTPDDELALARKRMAEFLG